MLWQYRRYVAPVLLGCLVLPLGLASVIAGVLASVPALPDNMMAAYVKAAKDSPVKGLRYEDLVAVDAIRFRQDFSMVTPESIQETIDFFKHCTTREDPETGHEVAECVDRSLEDVMNDLRFSPEDREYARHLVAALTVDGGVGDGESFVFTPSGPYTWPMDGFYTITSPYGARLDPETGEEGFHTGVDIAAPMYTPVRAAATGVVKIAGWDGNYGQMVYLDNGGFRTKYAHLSMIKVRPGDIVAAGEVIGLSGSTGKSTGPHLHLEWWTNGMPVDPMRYFGGRQ